MRHTKFLAVFAVLVMTLGCLTCLATATDNDASNDLNDQGTVVLYVDKDFRGNEKELNKLGITSPNCWVKDNKDTTIVLDNVEYTTKKAHAVVFLGSCTNLNIVVKGENTITCGTVKNEGTYTDGIYVHETITNTTISGNGTLQVVCDGVNDGNGGSAIYVDKNLTISGCKVVAVGPDVHQTGTKTGDYSSSGISVNIGYLVVENKAKVYGYGGDVYAEGECQTDDGVKHSTKSTGIYVGVEGMLSTLTMDNALLFGFGGDVESKAPGFAQRESSLKIDVNSTGIYVANNIELTKAILRGYGGEAKGDYVGEGVDARKNVSSDGMKFNTKIVAVNSEIFMAGGKAISSELAVSAGIRHFGMLGAAQTNKMSMSLDNCDLYAYGYISNGTEAAPRGLMGGSFGLLASEVVESATSFDLTIALRSTVAVFEGYDVDNKHNSVGIRIHEKVASTSEPTPVGSIVINDSELTVIGHTKAIIIDDTKGIRFVGGNPDFIGVSDNVHRRPSEVKNPSALLSDDCKMGVIRYHYVMYVQTFDGIYSPIKSYRFDDAKVKLPSYELQFTPEGKKFKCWSIDGKEYNPGDVVDISKGNFVAIAKWVDDKGSNNNDIIWICLAIAIIVIVLLLIVYFSLRKPSAAKKSEKKPVAKKKAAKPKAKPKSTAKKTTVKKAPAKKSTVKKTAKPKAKAKK